MKRLLMAPVHLLGRFICLGLGYLLFGAGSWLFLFLFFGDHPDRPGRLVDTKARVTETRDKCRIRGERQSAWGLCEDVERKILAQREAFAGVTPERWVEVTFVFTTKAGRTMTRTMSAARLSLPADVAPGDHVPIRYDHKKPGYVVAAGSGGWPVLLLWMAIDAAVLLASFVLWTKGGGWRILARKRSNPWGWTNAA